MSKFTRLVHHFATQKLTHVPCLGCGAHIAIDESARRAHFAVCGLTSMGERILETGLRSQPVLIMFEKEI